MWNNYYSTSHVVIDIETLGTKKSSAILSISAIAFKGCYIPKKEVPEILGYYDGYIDLHDGLKYGIFDWDTLNWWMERTDQFSNILSRGRNKSAESVISNFLHFFDNVPCNSYKYVWGNSPDFDIDIIDTFIQSYNSFQFDESEKFHTIRDHTSFYNLRDVRTLTSGFDLKDQELSKDGKNVFIDMLPDLFIPNTMNTLKHNSLYDAFIEAGKVATVLGLMKEYCNDEIH